MKENRKNKGDFKVGHEPWHKGKQGVYSSQTIKKMSEAKKGRVPWNKGKKFPELSGINSPVWKGGKEASLERGCESRKRYYISNVDRIKQRSKTWAISNRVRYNKSMNEKRQLDLQFRIKGNLRSRLRLALKNNQKNGSAVRDLGCSISFLILHLESKFNGGMNWNNYGKNGWHIDHIIPLSHFDLTNREQFEKASHYTNLQPLWSWENISKSNKILEYVKI